MKQETWNVQKKPFHPKWDLNKGPLDLKSSTLSNKLERYPSSASLEQVNPNHKKPCY